MAAAPPCRLRTFNKSARELVLRHVQQFVPGAADIVQLAVRKQCQDSACRHTGLCSWAPAAAAAIHESPSVFFRSIRH